MAAGATTFALAWSGAAASAAEERGIDPNLGESLVEVQLPSKAAAVRLQLEADTYGWGFNGTPARHPTLVTATVFGTDDEIAALDAAGFDSASDEGRSSWRGRLRDRQADVRAERRADAAALDDPVVTPQAHEDEIVVLRVDYFENYAGRFLSVEAKDRDGRSTPDTAT